MRIGLASILSRRNDAPWAESIGFLGWLAEHGDEHGYANLWLGEHHFSEWGPSDSPLIWLAHLAARTKRIRLGTVVALVPFYHPIRLAEEMLLVDNLSGGRLDIGLGRGHAPIEVAALCPAPDRQADLFDDGFEIIRLAFTGEPFTFQGKYWTFPRLQLFPPPTAAGPDQYMVMTSPRSITFAAQHGAIPILGVRADDFVKGQLDQYVADATAAGLGEERIAGIMAKVTTGRFVCVGDTHLEARERALFAIGQYDMTHQIYQSPIEEFNTRNLIHEIPPAELTDAQLDDRAIWGTRDEIIDRMKALEAVGVHHVSALLTTPSESPAEARHHVQRFTDLVLPALRSALPD